MGSQKGLVQRIERKLEVTVGDAFARVFGGSIVPQEVEALLRREAAEGIRPVAGNRLLAPNEYIITLGMHDYQKVGADPDLTSDAFAKHLAGYIGEQGWQTYGDVVVRFEQSANLHTGQFRARGAVNPDVEPRPTASDPAPPQSNHAFGAEPGVPPMTDNSSYRGGPGQGRPGDEYYDERYGHPQDDPHAGTGSARSAIRRSLPAATPTSAAATPTRAATRTRAATPTSRRLPRPGRLPRAMAGYPDPARRLPRARRRLPRPRGGYPDQRGGYPDQGGYPPQYEQRPAGGYGGGPRIRPGLPPGRLRPARRPGLRRVRRDYGRGPARQDEGGYGAPDQRPAYPEQGGGYDQGYSGGRDTAGRTTVSNPSTAVTVTPPASHTPPPAAGTPSPDMATTTTAKPAEAGGYGGYGQGGYSASGSAVTLQLDDGSGRTYQLREGSNIVGRGQDAQFRLPDTGVSRRHLEIRWDGQVALLSDLNSTNGTTVNNAPVQEWQLADGDVIRLGHSEIIVRIH